VVIFGRPSGVAGAELMAVVKLLGVQDWKFM